jgi:DNA polymerase-3 subunit gamma/tau
LPLTRSRRNLIAMAQQEHYQGLARKWRPQRFEDLVGQESVTQGLTNALRQGRVAHGHLLHGPRGVGKTTTARIIAKALNCEQGPTSTPCGVCRHCIDITAGTDLDVIEFDAASNTGVDEMRELLERVVQAPFSSRHKVYIVDEVHMLSMSSFNALLKTLEEPPPHVIFIFATTEFEKVPETVRSRCVVHALRRLTADDIVRRLTQVAEGEGIALDATQSREIFGLIARSVEGGMRDALVIFDQLLALSDGQPTAEAAVRLLGLADQSALTHATNWLAEGNATQLLALIDDLVMRGRSLERFVKGLIAYLRDLMLLQAGADEKLIALSGDTLAAAKGQAASLPPATLFNILNHMFELEEKLKTSTQARFLVEFAMLRLAAIKPVIPLDDIMRRIGAIPEASLAGGVPQQTAVAPPAQRAATPAPDDAEAPTSSPATAVPLTRLSAIVQEIPRAMPQAAAPSRPRAAAMHDSAPPVQPAAPPPAAPPAAPGHVAPGSSSLNALLSPIMPRPAGEPLSPLAAVGPLGASPVLATAPAAAPANNHTFREAMQDAFEPTPDTLDDEDVISAEVPALSRSVATPAAPTEPDRRSPLSRAEAFLENPDAARRFKMLKEMFSGKAIDERGQPLPIG